MLASLLSLPVITTSLAAENDWEAVLRGITANTSDPIFLGVNPLPPDDPHWAMAIEYLETSPTYGRPYDVAKHLDTFLPTVLREEWDSPFANPLIVLLFAATGTKPAGDTTAWCAAFMSWCIERVGLSSAHSAASKAYRSFGPALWEKGGAFPTDLPAGSIAVFRSLSNPSHGHVAFYLGADLSSEKDISVLGGNQSDTIGVSRYRLDGDLELHSIRQG
ncbi:CHAP domain-containing protein [Devosia sp.]|uniref:CHAP domain-containing protein n=1 Tax=Devosia sp. TaxID=1871048 RepID=UPI002638ACF7|nr:CHAP domain-containing protein [Devosia sp.]